MDEIARLLDGGSERHGTAPPAGVGGNAERAAVIAALLHLQIGAGARAGLSIHLTLPHLRRGPLPLAPKGRRGENGLPVLALRICGQRGSRRSEGLSAANGV